MKSTSAKIKRAPFIDWCRYPSDRWLGSSVKRLDNEAETTKALIVHYNPHYCVIKTNALSLCNQNILFSIMSLFLI